MTTLEQLREHLSHPQSNIAFLFGAGTSCAVQIPVDPAAAGDANVATRSLIPNVIQLTEVCKKEIEKLDAEGAVEKFKPALISMLAELGGQEKANIEHLLSCVRRKIHALGEGDTLAGLTRADLELVEETIQRTIASQVNPPSSNFPESLPHVQLARWASRIPREVPIEIFTTNYDILLEMAFDSERVPTFDGFVGCAKPFFLHESLSRPESMPATGWSRLWKIHGSITWSIENVSGRPRVVRVAPHEGGEMILPSHHKYDESRKQPYTALLDRLSRVMERENTVLIVCGYSFSDDHINAILFDALQARRRPHIIALQYTDPDMDSVLTSKAEALSNLMVLGPRVGIIGGKRGNWELSNPARGALIEKHFVPDENTADVADETNNSAPPTGQLMLGDFTNFCRFLESIAGA